VEIGEEVKVEALGMISHLVNSQLTTKSMNKFCYSITTCFIPYRKDYHSCTNNFLEVKLIVV